MYVLFKYKGKVSTSPKPPKQYDELWVLTTKIEDFERITKIPEAKALIGSLHPPRVDYLDNYVVLLLRVFIYREGKSKLIPLSIMFNDKEIITYTTEDHKLLEEVIEYARKSGMITPSFILTHIFKFILSNIRLAQTAIEEKLDTIYSRLVSHGRITTRQLIVIKNTVRHIRMALLDLNVVSTQLSNKIPELKDILREIEIALQENTYINERILSTLSLIFTINTDRLNIIVMKLTAISAIFLPLTLIASIYGMNFKYMPELEHPLGYPLTLIAMTLIGIILALYFKYKKWL